MIIVWSTSEEVICMAEVLINLRFRTLIVSSSGGYRQQWDHRLRGICSCYVASQQGPKARSLARGFLLLRRGRKRVHHQGWASAGLQQVWSRRYSAGRTHKGSRPRQCKRETFSMLRAFPAHSLPITTIREAIEFEFSRVFPSFFCWFAGRAHRLQRVCGYDATEWVRQESIATV